MTPSLPDSAHDDGLREKIGAACNVWITDKKLDEIMSLIRAAIQSGMPEKKEIIYGADKYDWEEGYNAAISEIEASLKAKGLL
jgi:hypothetical protein